MNDIVEIISELGFPIVIAMFLLFRIESKLERLIKSIESLINVLGSNK